MVGRHTSGAEAPILIWGLMSGLKPGPTSEARAKATAKSLRMSACCLTLFGGVETEADVVGGPVAIGVAEDGFEERYGLGEDCGAVGWGELIEDSVAEGVEPGVHTVGEWGGAWN